MKHFVIAKYPCEDPAQVLFHIEAKNVQKAAEWICSQAQVVQDVSGDAKIIIPKSLLQEEIDQGETCYTYRRDDIPTKDDIPIIDTSSPDTEWTRTLYLIEVPSVSIP